MNFETMGEELKVGLKANNKAGVHFSVLNVVNKDRIEDINKLIDKTGKSKFHYFERIAGRTVSRSHLYLGYDERLHRPVTIKMARYRDKGTLFAVSDYESKEAVLRKRQMLKRQIEILNDINSPLLPEPIDYFEVENDDENLPAELRKNEPVLVFDFLSGKTLHHYIRNGRRTIEQRNQEVADGEKDVVRNSDIVEVRERLRVVQEVIIFLKELREKGYAHQTINTKHIFILKDKTPRILGIGGICKTNNDVLDQSDINFRACDTGYSAPELNNPNIPAEKITSQGVGAFSLGVVIHQLIGNYDNLDIQLVDEFGAFKYPNGITEEAIKNSKLKGYLVHQLICRLCHPNVDERLTDYDVISAELEKIIGTSQTLEQRLSSKQFDRRAESVSWTYNNLNIKHCEHDNTILEEAEIGISVYNSQKKIKYVPTKAYYCSECEQYYIDEEIYENIKEEYENIYTEEDETSKYDLVKTPEGDYESVYIRQFNSTRTYMMKNKLIQMDHNVKQCIYDDDGQFEKRKVALAYYAKGDKEKLPQGRLIVQLLVCEKCRRAYITKAELLELEKLLPNRDQYEFYSTHYKEEIKTASELYLMDRLNYCVKDLTTLKYSQTKITYYDKETKGTGSIICSLPYCPECNTFYVTESQRQQLKKERPNAIFSVKARGKTISMPMILEKGSTVCEYDLSTLIKEDIRIWKNSETDRSYQVRGEAYRCRQCDQYYMTPKEYARLDGLLPDQNTKIAIKEQTTIKVQEVLVSKSIETCPKHKAGFVSKEVQIATFNKMSQTPYKYIRKEVAFCPECNEIYMTPAQVQEFVENYPDIYIQIKEVKGKLTALINKLLKEDIF